jgi:hypothetical protein
VRTDKTRRPAGLNQGRFTLGFRSVVLMQLV